MVLRQELLTLLHYGVDIRTDTDKHIAGRPEQRSASYMFTVSCVLSIYSRGKEAPACLPTPNALREEVRRVGDVSATATCGV